MELDPKCSLRFNRHLRRHGIEVVRELLLVRADVAHATGLKARSSSSPEDLQDIEDGEIGEGTLGTVIHLRALDDH